MLFLCFRVCGFFLLVVMLFVGFCFLRGDLVFRIGFLFVDVLVGIFAVLLVGVRGFVVYIWFL